MAKCKYFVAGAFIGAVVGAAVAVLTTPRNGKEMREELEKNLELTKEKGKEFYYSLVNEPVDSVYKDTEKEDSYEGWMDCLPRKNRKRPKKSKRPGKFLRHKTICMSQQNPLLALFFKKKRIKGGLHIGTLCFD